MTTSKAYIALNIMQRIGPVRVRRLTEAFGSPATVLTTPLARFQAVSIIDPEEAKALTNWDSRVEFPS
jgi:DNA processing protein